MIIDLKWLRFAFASGLLLANFQAEAAEPQAVSTPTYQMIQAAIAEKIRDEFSGKMLDQDMKTALLNSAAPEDKIELQRLLASYKYSKSHVIEAVGTNLRMSDKKGKVLFEVRPPELGKTEFLLNGRSWTMPESGSILRDLNRHLNPTQDTPKKSGANRSLPARFFEWAGIALQLVKEADAAAPSPEVLPLYYYVRAAGKSTPQALRDMIKETSLDSSLLHGAHFQSTGELDWAKAVFKGITLSRYDVQCTPEGAKGFAMVGGTKVEFVARPDQGVQLKSDGNSQVVFFEPRQLNPGNRRMDLEFYGGNLQRLSADAASSAYQKNRLESDIGKLERETKRLCRIKDELGYLAQQPKLLDQTSTACAKFNDLQNQRSYGPERSVEEQMSIFATGMKAWYTTHKNTLLEAAAQLDKISIVSDRSLDVKACTDATCTSLLSGKEFESYRIPPNKTEEVVEKALAFKASSSAGRSAKIEYNCPTKNNACQSVTLVGGESLSGADLKRAQDLLRRANDSLRWKQYDPSVAQPVARLRLLGPCCADTACRALAFDKGVNLIPTKGKGTAK